MEQNNQQVTLNDVLGETLETYLTVEDANILRTAFKDNKRLLKALQKIFIPTIQDPDMPPESIGEDFWLAGKNWSQVPEAERGALIVGREEALRFITGGLIRLKAISNVKEESYQEVAKRRAKDSTK